MAAVAEVALLAVLLVAVTVSASYAAPTVSWTVEPAPIPTARAYPAATESGGVIYVIGGQDAIGHSATNDCFDPASGTWQTMSPMPTPRQMLGAATLNGLVYAVGGNSQGSSLDNVEVYDPSTNTWTTAAVLPEPLALPAVAAAGGRLYVIGGDNYGNRRNTVYEYDPATDVWTTKTPMPTVRWGARAATIDGKIYVAGGENGSYFGTLEVYDPATDEWVTRAPMSNPRSCFGAAVLGGRLYAAAGSGPSEASWTSAESYNPATNTWGDEGVLGTVRTATTAAAGNGGVYLFGGYGTSSAVLVASVEVGRADVTSPTTSVGAINPNGANGWYITTATVTLTRDEPGTTYYQWNSNAPGSFSTYSAPLTAPEGQNTLYYFSVDTSDNTETVQAQVIKVDTIAPSASITAPSQDATVSGNVGVIGTAIDSQFVRYTLEFGAGKRPLSNVGQAGVRYGTWWRQITDSASPVSGSTLANWDTTVLDDSYHTLRLVVWDDAGNSAVQLRAVKVGNGGRPWLDEVTMDATDFVPDISADGSKIAFSSDRLGNIDNWIASSAGVVQSAVATHSAEDRHLSFSPDGQSAVFMSNRAGNFDIWKSNLDGSGLVQLTSAAANEVIPTFSADGTKIVYMSDAAGNNDICIMNADGSGQTVIVSDTANDMQPDISPDGSKVAFASNRYGMDDLFVVNSDGTGLTRVTSYSGSDAHPTFSPDGQTLAFQRGVGGGFDVWTIGLDGSAPSRLTTDPAPDLYPTWSTAGKIVFSSGRSGMLDIYTMNADGSNEQRVTFSVDDFIPDVNADSSRVAFTSNRARDYTSVAYGVAQGDIYLVDPNGANLAPVGDLSSYANHPSFSPNGQQLAFSSNRAGVWDIWKADLDGSSAAQLTGGASREALPTWGPDGRITYISNVNGNEDVFIMNQDGSAQSAVTTDPATDYVPDLATSGQLVGFGSNRNGPGDVFTARPDGTDLTQVTPDPVANESHPSFGPGGTELTYVSGGATSDLYRMGLDGSGLTRLTYDAAAESVNTWGADGRTLVFSTSRTTGDSTRRSIWRMAVEPDAVAPAADATPPTTSILRTPANPDGSNGWFRTAPVVTLSVNETATTYYQLDSTSTAGWSTYSSPLTAPEGEHYLYYFSVDSADNTETVQRCPGSKVDTGAPSAVTLSAAGQSATTVDLSWTAGADAVSGVAGYRVFDASDDSLVTSATATAATVSGLSPSTSYSFYVRTLDVAGNESTSSNVVTAQTGVLAGSEVVPVPPGANVTATASSGVVVVFDNVTDAGSLAVTRTADRSHGQPDGFWINGGDYYDVSFSGSFTGELLVTLPYDDTGMSPAREARLKLFHWKDNGWEDVTVSVDTVANTITGRATSFSPFAVTEPIGYTGTGSDVRVTMPNGVSVIFDQVTVAGTLTATPSSPSPPSGLSAVPGAAFDIGFTGAFTGGFTVTVPFDPASVTGAESAVVLFHYTGGQWANITTGAVDTVNHTVSGRATSFSPFLVGSWTNTGGLPFSGYKSIHGGYTLDTDACAGCHRTHTSFSSLTWTDSYNNTHSALLVSSATEMYEFCYACHGADVQGADTNVQEGIYEGTLYGEQGGILNGGGFESLGPTATTSTHMYTGGGWGAYGGGVFGAAAASPFDPAVGATGQIRLGETDSLIEMDCATCHDPHGSSNYRILKDRVYGNRVGGYYDDGSGFAASQDPTPTPWVTSVETGFPEGGWRLHWVGDAQKSVYQPNFTTSMYARGATQTSADVGSLPGTDKGMTGWCVGCHGTYNTKESTYNAGDKRVGDDPLFNPYTLRHRHPMNVPLTNFYGTRDIIATDNPLPLAHNPFSEEGSTVVNTAADWVECLTCHRAHGTSAIMTGYANSLSNFNPTPNSGSGGVPPADSSALLRGDNRYVCEACHNK